jgi:ABC-type polysaccharide transport system permease subunit
MTTTLRTRPAEVVQRPRPAFWTTRRRDQLTGYLFVAPQLIGIVVFVLIPLVLVFWYSLHEWNVLADTFDFVGTENYRRLVEDPRLPGVLRATLLFSAGLVIFNLGNLTWLWLVYAGGLEYLLIAAVFYLVGTALFVWARRESRLPTFTAPEWVVVAVVALASVAAVVMMATGNLAVL